VTSHLRSRQAAYSLLPTAVQRKHVQNDRCKHHIAEGMFGLRLKLCLDPGMLPCAGASWCTRAFGGVAAAMQQC
jgi:hypothetical protein